MSSRPSGLHPVTRRPAPWRPRLAPAVLFAALVALFMVPLHPRPAAAEAKGSEYRLGAEDRVRLLVYEWRATVDTVFAWSSLNAEFTVGASGAISLPILGDVKATGLTTAELAQAIGDRLKATIGLVVAPNIGVEVVHYRPFYIMGGVNKPGEYAFRPGLTVLQALSVAGGLLGTGESGLRAGHEAIQSRGELEAAAAEIIALQARRARLEAELKDAEAIQFPPELERRKAEPAVAVVEQQEQLIFQSRRKALTTEIAALEQLKEFLAKEVESIQGQLKTHAVEGELMKKELGNISALVGRGLAPITRQTDLERAISRMDGDHLRLETTLLTAKQGISRADISIIEARSRRSNEAALNLRDAQNRLDAALTRYATAERQLYGSRYAMLADRSAKGAVTFHIVRTGKEVQVGEDAVVEPGDTVKVELPAPKEMGQPTATP